ncbi:MAG: LysM peptidoglycan-binding domain-containing protein [Acetivibrionales bacterium]
MQIHVVQRGEALWMIARRYGVSIQDIVRANQLPDPNRLVVGQDLIIPEPDIIHIVRPGETLWQIAQRYGVGLNEIIQRNQIVNPSLINVGQRLIIPSPTNIYTVQRGDTLWSIARAHGTTVDVIIRDNQITNPSLIYPGQRLVVRRPIIEVNGYLTRMGAEGQEIVREVGDSLTYLSVFSYGIQEDGGLSTQNDVEVLGTARQERVAPLMTLTNFRGRRFSPELANSVLGSPQVQETLITNILDTMGRKGYRGLNIDFEYVFPQDRENYNQFLRRVVNRLRPQGFLVSTALAPKETAGQIGLLYEAHDYPVHGQLTDFVVLMTYEWGYAAGPPWAIAPINKVRDILDYAVTAIPRNKILMGMPTYGRDWRLPFVQGQTIATSISPPAAVDRAAYYGVPIQFNTLYQSPFFEYTDEQGVEHVVWFEDARSVREKFNLVKEYGLRGVSYWELSSPFPQNWTVLRNTFQVRKIV